MHWHKLVLLPGLCLMLIARLAAQDIFDAEIMEVRIHFQEGDWHDILKQQKLSQDKAGLLATVQVGGNGHDSVRVRYKGNSSFHGAVKAGILKLPFHLKTRKGDKFGGGYRELRLSNNYRDPSAIRELLGFRIVGTYMPVPRVCAAIVWVNDEYLGVYTATEGIEKPMLKRHFGSDDGVLIKCEWDIQRVNRPPPGCPRGSFASLEYLGEEARCYEGLYEVDKPEHWDGLITLALALEEHPEHVGNLINVEQVLWMHALNNVMVNLDSYLGIFSHNYFMYQDAAGLYHPLIWDLNLAFGGFTGLKEGVKVDIPDMIKLSPIVHAREKLDNRPLLTRLLQVEAFREIYYQCLGQVVEDWFANDRYLAVADTLQASLRPWIQRETHGFFSSEDFDRSLHETVKRSARERSIIGIAELMRQRTTYLVNHPLLRRKPVVD
ncbi:MAG: CotH kinase family protein [Saprospiraceae bacterium]|nr:CotH kinase family protein [Saprospiraceae bacterium]